MSRSKLDADAGSIGHVADAASVAIVRRPLPICGCLLEVGGTFFESELYADASARHAGRLDKRWKTLSTKFGLQDRHAGSVVFVIKGDGKEIFRSPVIKDRKVHEETVSVAGMTLLELIVEDAGDGANSDWRVWLDPQLRR